MDHFACQACGCERNLALLSDLGCSCLLCKPCATMAVQQQLQQACAELTSSSAGPRPESFSSGQKVWYRQRDGSRMAAVVVQVDNSIQPPQYGIDITGTVRYTEGSRLTPAHDQQLQDISQLTKGSQVWYQQRDNTWTQATILQVDNSIQPPQFALQLPGTTEARYTELHRLALLLPSSTQDGSSPAAFTACCPRCQARLSQPHLCLLVPQALEQLHQLQTDLWLQRHGIIRCPNPSCNALIERVPAAAESGAFQPSSAAAAPAGGLEAAQHKHQHYYRCAMCSQSFCDECRSTPYHAGYTCKQHAAPECLFCDQKVLEELLLYEHAARPRELRKQLDALGVDSSQCLERSEMLELVRLRRQCCGAGSCLDSLNGSCLQLLPCGHHCRGRRGHGACLPCLEEACVASPSAAGAAGGCCFCLEPLPSSPCLLLTCGHAVHASCAKARLAAKWPGPELSFRFLFCPLCGSGEARCGNVQVMTSAPHLQDESLDALLEPLLNLRSHVVQLAKRRLQVEGLTRSDPELQPGGRFDGRPADYAMTRFLFYQCAKCRMPYVGGARACGAAAADAGGGPAPFDAQELLCGGCCASDGQRKCLQHEERYIEWKCRYCCSSAAWFCWGSTHMCDPCHQLVGRGQNPPPHRCPGAGRCPLQLPHPAPGQEFCLGCSMCRHEQQAL